jgi:dTDP-4-amino-4,6-dideoxygalactose transaminase
MKIEKVASSKRFNRELYFFDRARDGFRYLLNKVSSIKDGIVLLPSFIGWSALEGSGVFDPVRESSMEFDFYAMNEKLHIDIDDLQKKFNDNKVAVFVIIHYYGHIDPCYKEVINLARKYSCVILEDEAHALYSDIIDGKCGRSGDAIIFSIHKMLPLKNGGALGINNENVLEKPNNESAASVIFNYDLWTIAQKRKKNARLLHKLTINLDGVKPLWGSLDETETLQSFPVIVEDVDRNILYEIMNNDGFGVVSLYHTLIPEITKEKFPKSHELASKIMNLPVHQDANIDSLEIMCQKLQEAVHKLRRK